MLKRRLTAEHAAAAAAVAENVEENAEEEADEEEEEENVEDEADEADASCATAPRGGKKPPLSTADRTERRRKQCRISQRRYRDKKGSMEYNLKLDINDLRESVERLRQARGLLESKIQNDRRVLRQSVLKAVEQYYAMFRHGLHDPHAGEHVRKCYEIQVNFLRAFMDPQVECGGETGVDVVLEQWRRYSRYHSAIRVELLGSEVFGSDSSPIVKAKGILTVTVNRSTLENVFPHILADEDLTHYLVGKQVEYTTCTEYVFDAKVQVIRQDFTVDFLSGLGAVLRNPFVTSEVLREAQIAHASMLGPRGDDDEDQAEDHAEPPEWRGVRIKQEQKKEQKQKQEQEQEQEEQEEDEDQYKAESEHAAAARASRLDLHFIMS